MSVLKKKIISLSLAGIFLISGSCMHENDDNIKLYDENNNELSVIVVADIDSSKERYGYIINMNNKIIFKDILDNKTYDINDNEVFFCDFKSILTGLDYNYICNNKNISLSKIKYYEKDCNVIKCDESYGIYPYYGNDYVKVLKKLEVKKENNYE